MHMMKNTFTRFLALTAALVLSAGTALAGSEGWHTDFAKAKAKAVEHDKLLLVEFHGSDWCPPCIALKKEVFSTDAFKEFAKDKFVLVDIDFPRKTKLPEAQMKANGELAEKFRVEGFPTILVMTPEGEVVGREVGYSRGGKDEFMAFLAKHSDS